jgi:hypothetical protein
MGHSPHMGRKPVPVVLQQNLQGRERQDASQVVLHKGIMKSKHRR